MTAEDGARLRARIVVDPALPDGVLRGIAQAVAETGAPEPTGAAPSGGAPSGRAPAVGRLVPDRLVPDRAADAGPLAYVGPALPAGLRDDPRLVWFHSSNAGVDAALASAGGGAAWPERVLLTRTVGRMRERMAQYVLGWVLAECQFVPEYVAQQAAREWRRLPGELAAGQLAVVVGAGEIGRAVGAALRANGIRTAGVSRSRRAAAEAFDEVLTARELLVGEDDLLGRARWVVGVLPLTSGTREFFGAEFFARLRGASFLNIGRGASVDLAALESALTAGQVRSAVLDVLAEEPAPPDAPCWRLPRTVVTSHSSGVTDDADVVADFAAARRALAAGRTPALTVVPARGY